MKRFYAFVATLLALVLSVSALSARELNLIPEPSYVDLEAEGDYVVTEKTRITVVDDLWQYRFAAV